MTDTPKVINIRPLQKQPTIIVDINGTRHERARHTLAQVIETVKDVEALAEATSMAHQLEIVANVVLRSFPTLDRETLMGLEEGEVDMLFSAARGEVFEGEVEDAEGNDKPAS